MVVVAVVAWKTSLRLPLTTASLLGGVASDKTRLTFSQY